MKLWLCLSSLGVVDKSSTDTLFWLVSKSNQWLCGGVGIHNFRKKSLSGYCCGWWDNGSRCQMVRSGQKMGPTWNGKLGPGGFVACECRHLPFRALRHVSPRTTCIWAQSQLGCGYGQRCFNNSISIHTIHAKVRRIQMVSIPFLPRFQSIKNGVGNYFRFQFFIEKFIFLIHRPEIQHLNPKINIFIFNFRNSRFNKLL